MKWADPYLLFGVTVAANSPQVFESSPQEDDEESPKESDHGGGEESPPHPLAVAVTRHIWRERDDHIHLGDVDGRIRVEFIPVFRHYSSGQLPASAPPTTINSIGRILQALWGAPASAPWCPSGSAMLSQPPPAPLSSHLASPRDGRKSWVDGKNTHDIKTSFEIEVSVVRLTVRVHGWNCASSFDLCARKPIFSYTPQKLHIFVTVPVDKNYISVIFTVEMRVVLTSRWIRSLLHLVQQRSSGAHCWMRSSR